MSSERIDWFIFNGSRSDDYGAVVELVTLPPRPERRVTSLYVPGMDGELTQSDDTYNTIPITIKCHWPRPADYERINQWLRGNGDLVLPSALDKCYKARVDQIMEYEDLYGILKSDVLFIAQPFRYEATPDTVTLTASGAIVNPGTRWSQPVMDVYGAGTLTIEDGENTYTLVIEATAGESYVTINSEIEECYYGVTSRNSKVTGTFPKLQPGLITVTLGTGITRVDITGNWRWY